MDKIAHIKKVLTNSIAILNNKYIKRYSKITFKDILYGLSVKTINNTSYDKVVFSINTKNNTSISASGFKKKRDIMTPNDLISINNTFLNLIYKNNKHRILAVDGTRIKCLKAMHSEGFKFASNNKTYTHCAISGLYDTDSNIVINYTHSVSLNEREAFINQLDYVKKGDIVLFDRGYYSNDLMDTLNYHGINYVFRVKNNINVSKHLIDNNISSVLWCDKLQAVTYTLYEEAEPYFLLTNLVNMSINELQSLYKRRWSIETHFKEAKYTTNMNNLNSTTINSYLKDINMHNFVLMLYYYFYSIIKPQINRSIYALNHKLGVEIFINDILYILLYNTKYNKLIQQIITIMPKTHIHKPDRHYERISKRTISSWYIRPQRNRDNRRNIAVI